MAKFLADSALNAELENMFLKAKEEIILISPYIRLHARFIAALNEHKKNPSINIILIFGKNEDDMSKSMKHQEFDYFKEFPNIEIRHEERLHAKYYANETYSILTSMNLYSASQNTNIEFGVMTKKSLIGSIAKSDNLDYAAWEYFMRVIENSNLLFQKVTERETKFGGIMGRFQEPKIIVDKLTEFFEKKYSHNNKKQSSKIADSIVSKSSKTKHVGFCIRTGVEIPFNVERPMSYDAYKLWNKYADPDYPEKYCHYSGGKSNGKTSVSKPILGKYWKEAQRFIK